MFLLSIVRTQESFEVKIDRIVEIESEIGALVLVDAHENVMIETCTNIGRRILEIDLARIVLDEPEVVDGGHELHLQVVVDVVDVELSERQVLRGRAHQTFGKLGVELVESGELTEHDGAGGRSRRSMSRLTQIERRLVGQIVDGLVGVRGRVCLEDDETIEEFGETQRDSIGVRWRSIG